MGGLSAAALLAKAGKKVLVVERHDRPGGYAHSFQRKKYVFDAAVHLISGCEPVQSETGGLIDGLLRLFGVRDRCTFLQVNPFYTAMFPGFRLNAPLGIEEYIKTHLEHFPTEKEGLRQLIQLCTRVNQEVRQFPTEFSFWDVMRMPKRFPLLLKYHKATLAKVMDEHIRDPRLKAAFATLWPYLGVPPSRLSFLYWSVMLMSYIEKRAHFTAREVFKIWVNAFVEALQKNGGELLLRSRVRKILVKDRRVTGVMLENGQRILAPIVISNADARQTFEEMVGVAYLPRRFVKNLGRMTPSLSAFVVYMATDLDMQQMNAGHEMFLYRSWDHDETHQNICEGKPAGIVVTVPTLIDPSLAPPGEHLVTITTLIPYEIGASWRQKKARYGDLLLDEIEAVFPSFHDHITFAEEASPRTMERYTLNFTGAVYGWEVSPEQVGRNRLEHQTPIEGLYLLGHWTQPGGGIYAVVVSGLQTAQIVLGYPNVSDFLSALQDQNP